MSLSTDPDPVIPLPSGTIPILPVSQQTALLLRHLARPARRPSHADSISLVFTTCPANQSPIQSLEGPKRVIKTLDRRIDALAERFVCSIGDECLDRMIFFGESSLRYAVTEYVEHHYLHVQSRQARMTFYFSPNIHRTHLIATAR